MRAAIVRSMAPDPIRGYLTLERRIVIEDMARGGPTPFMASKLGKGGFNSPKVGVGGGLNGDVFVSHTVEHSPCEL